MEMTGAIEEYVMKRISSLQKFIQNKNTLCEIELAKTTNHHKSGDVFKAEANISMPHDQVYAVSEQEDLYVAIDDLREELERILSSHKDKKITLFRRGAQRIKNMIKQIKTYSRFNKK
jgi:putative sigma-54 modulation protein